ncbi:hypothetical protein Q7C_2613 [Methylophaga frappieri]|uniref:Lipoprotein n=1 Tax=Methylophaga frappieri (strain ATCC BAA-2434 / DSM 25690 / JAM7) TaxID=754477 RepID=I1YLE1_METFJ|nr:hypothetical protein [Methylophaga frappieri]AFJ03734.1 hypothetical protein Q7C_2613 [Methylophaga frappieri]
MRIYWLILQNTVTVLGLLIATGCASITETVSSTIDYVTPDPGLVEVDYVAHFGEKDGIELEVFDHRFFVPERALSLPALFTLTTDDDYEEASLRLLRDKAFNQSYKDIEKLASAAKFTPYLEAKLFAAWANKLSISKSVSNLVLFTAMKKKGYRTLLVSSLSQQEVMIATHRRLLLSTYFLTDDNTGEPYGHAYPILAKYPAKFDTSNSRVVIKTQNMKPLDIFAGLDTFTNHKRYEKVRTRQVSFFYKGKRLRIDLDYSVPVSQYHYRLPPIDYEQSGDYITKYTVFDAFTGKSMRAAVAEYVDDPNNKLEVARFLLAMTQYGFEYKTDDEYYGHSHPVFAKAMLLPRTEASDCEDKTFFFNASARLFGIETAIALVPGHMFSLIALPPPSNESHFFQGRWLAAEATGRGHSLGEVYSYLEGITPEIFLE